MGYHWYEGDRGVRLSVDDGDPLPTPAAGDAGKVPTVKDDLTGYQLDTPSGGGGLDLSVYRANPNGYQVEYNGAATPIDNVVPFDTAYMTADESASVPLVDDDPHLTNDWLEIWRANGATSVEFLKMGLWKLVAIIDLDGPLTHKATMSPQGAGHVIGYPGDRELRFDGTVFISDTTQTPGPLTTSPVFLQFDAADSALNFSYCFVSMIPLVTVDPLT